MNVRMQDVIFCEFSHFETSHFNPLSFALVELCAFYFLYTPCHFLHNHRILYSKSLPLICAHAAGKGRVRTVMRSGRELSRRIHCTVCSRLRGSDIRHR